MLWQSWCTICMFSSDPVRSRTEKYSCQRLTIKDISLLANICGCGLRLVLLFWYTYRCSSRRKDTSPLIQINGGNFALTEQQRYSLIGQYFILWSGKFSSTFDYPYLDALKFYEQLPRHLLDHRPPNQHHALGKFHEDDQPQNPDYH